MDICIVAILGWGKKITVLHCNYWLHEFVVYSTALLDAELKVGELQTLLPLVKSIVVPVS